MCSAADDPKRVVSNSARENERPVIFLCTGQGSQYVSMGRGLYESEPEFRSTIDFCADYLCPFIGVDLRTILFPSETASERSRRVAQSDAAHPAGVYSSSNMRWPSCGRRGASNPRR